MGRHRRSAAGRAATGRADHANPSDAAESPASPDTPVGPFHTPGPDVTSGTGSRPRSHRRKARAATPVRTGLLGVSAAVAMGAVAVASGLLPGGDTYTFGGSDGAGAMSSATSPSDLDPQGGDSGTAERGPARAPGTGRAEAPAPTPSPAASDKPSAKPSKKPPAEPPRGEDRDDADRADRDEAPDEKTEKPAPPRADEPEPTPPVPRPEPSTGDSSAEAQVLALVNEERAKVGCRPVSADGRLAALAEGFSADMAERGFFSHTDPDGATPWDRAEKAGIKDLGGENIARGQADAQAVMDAWMNSPGHRANILNCDYKTLGVGAHFAPGGPWWTQDFGF
ncbi:Cysteine-rich secretory protein family protein [Streptomyces sp. YIM 121038]|uniref:CAP domain-containing protein n=1 Tax=Streptomyces sp. YIM 121038 TaxID=2136401 RepID=UPI001110F776|nr:CAP domain-containing protein [Streptomyces sp. YIM 121038]QCX79397.1 Cysteine-rich secretory protein family protein [Streptomyces sp. YIM 121038]